MNTRILLSALLLAAASHSALAAPPIYRCGSSYSQTPCVNAQEILVDDARDAAQKKQADEATRREAAAARSLEQQRLAQEKQALKNAPKQLGGQAAPKPQAKASEPIKKRPHKRQATDGKKSEYFTAQVSGSGKAPKNKVPTPQPGTPASD